jgi:N6-adenosine-specific RNA methylase IME4
MYRTIVADPPWKYGSTRGTGIRPGNKPGGAEIHYPTMRVDEIAALPVSSLADRDAHLYLWTTNTFMVEAHRIAEAWGFSPKTVITWTKTRKADQQPSMKMGYYYKGATEHIVFAVRGSLRLRGPAHPTAILHPRLGHSVKPEYSYRMIEEQSPGPYLELFARRPREGWDVWGNEVDSDVDVEGVA